MNLRDPKLQFLTLTKHAIRGARIISSSKIKIYQIGLYLKIHLHAKLMYPLACINTALSSSDYNNTWPLVLQYSDYHVCGLNLQYIETESNQTPVNLCIPCSPDINISLVSLPQYYNTTLSLYHTPIAIGWIILFDYKKCRVELKLETNYSKSSLREW